MRRCRSGVNSTRVAIKYAFPEDRARRRLQEEVVRVMNSLAQVHGSADDPARIVGWLEYATSVDASISRGEESLIEAAHFVADLAAVDGAVVLAKNLELLGFGAEVSGALEPVSTVVRALDIDAMVTQRESPESYGTRHRSAYRLCKALPEAIAIVISQDGGVRSIKCNDGHVTCWDQVATGILDV